MPDPSSSHVISSPVVGSTLHPGILRNNPANPESPPDSRLQSPLMVKLGHWSNHPSSRGFVA
jgi:hypothetical protein